MRLLFAVIGFLGFSLSASAAGEWLYYKHYPWVYDNVSKDWLYLSGDGGKVIAYRASTSEWEDFTVPDTSLPSSIQLQLHTNVTLEFILVQGGTFYMGETGIAEPVHQVKLTKPYYLAKFETTSVQYDSIMNSSFSYNGSNESNYNKPKNNLTYNQVLDYISELNSQHQANLPDGWEFILPTEAQWEYACKAGTTTSFAFGNTISQSDANFKGPEGVTPPLKVVGTYPPNDWGFYDMHGNVEEWTSTHYHNYEETYIEDPVGPETGSQVMVRGGNYNSYADWILRSAYRTHQYKTAKHDTIGFRLSLQEKPN
ncbi:MAG: SUMF1/EgtB/PvdO family nonheme iron enzyme [Bacteroidetes bacterium]|nr:SUMF1/EgtB/PvdO family nonheme iron enzyme [Bacteroidota bacterium]